jgi:iron complex transport system ATP-binding protein
MHKIKIDNITCGYHESRVIKNITFGVREGEFLGVIGPNGSGKSTLLKSLSRSLKPFSGSILYEDKNIYEIPQEKIAREFAFVSQDTVFNFSFTVWEVILMGRIPYLKRMQRESANDLRIVKDAMQLTDTLKLADREVGELSAGEKQMMLIARALAQEPKVLFLDEPTSHLDIGHQVGILNLIRSLNHEKNITVIIVLHDLNLASEYCQRLALLNDGSLFRIGAPKEVLTYQNIEEVYKTLVLVNKNPVSGNPHILLLGKHSK